MTDRPTDGGDCNIPDAFLKKRGDNNVQNAYCWYLFSMEICLKKNRQLIRKHEK